ncbi:lysine--tRNA ligase [Candidatus Saccharibacteria bacterium]|nr:lysine--tRNA ligase [Candidatus Saccharibacteria bacterium]
MANLKELRDERLRKLEDLKKLGINPYPASSRRTHNNVQIIDNFSQLEGKQVTVVGRIISIRKFGKIAFVVIKDNTGELQLFWKEKEDEVDTKNSEVGLEHISLLDTGDFVQCEGEVIKTQTGEISVEVAKLRLLTKSLRPMPNKQDGFTNKEERLRRRYVDINVNDDVKQRFIRRSKFWQATRDFLNNEGFIEINTPVLEHTTGGADANPFVTHMDAIDEDFYLRISHELPLKRLIGAGYEKVYDIGPRFRNENYSDEHLPEHIAFESYSAYQDYTEGMELYERMMKEVALKTWGTLKFKNVHGFDIDLEPKWPVVRYPDIMKEKFGVDVFNPDLEQLKKILSDHKVNLDGEINTNRAMDSVWKIIRKESAGPFWLINEPLSISPLAKQDPDDPRVTQRFHPVIAGSELGNGYSELNDPIDQLNRFLEQQEMRDAGDAEAQMLDIDFVEMLEYGMPPTCGYSYSERYFWFFEGVTAREGVPFPQLRSEVDDVTKSTYPEVYAAMDTKAHNSRPQDFGRRVVILVNKELEPWKMANSVAHMSAYMGNQLSKDQFDTGDYFLTHDGQKLPRNSQYPIIIKRAEEKELHKVLVKVRESRLRHHVFIKEMQDTTNDQEIVDILRRQTEKDTTFYGLAIFGDNDNVNRLTKNFQLYK